MVRLNKDSSSAGRATTVGRMEEILNNMNGTILIVVSDSGVLSFNMLDRKENYGYLLEILCLILQLRRDGKISVEVDIS